MKGRYPKFKAAQSARGLEISRWNASSIATFNQPKLAWLIRVSVPFSYAASKNHIWTLKDRDPVRSRARSMAFRQYLASAIRDCLPGRRVAHNKLWLDIFVQKPNHKGDAVNVVDLVCDAVKDATGLDDRWYSIRSVDWEIVKGDGRLFVGIGQDSDEDLQVCSSCGRALALGLFASNRSNRAGRSRNCNDCRRVGAR